MAGDTRAIVPNCFYLAFNSEIHHMISYSAYHTIMSKKIPAPVFVVELLQISLLQGESSFLFV